MIKLKEILFVSLNSSNIFLPIKVCEKNNGNCSQMCDPTPQVLSQTILVPEIEN